MPQAPNTSQPEGDIISVTEITDLTLLDDGALPVNDCGNSGGSGHCGGGSGHC